jgi:acetyltransferase-like isoleucine patch superfamily enzyme
MSEPDRPTVILGQNCRIDEPSILGRTWQEWKEPLRIGDHAIVRPYAVIYTDTVIGDRFQCGYFVLVRAECKVGNRVTLMSRVTLEGRVEIGNATKIMAHCYLPSRTRIGNSVFMGPGVTVLNDRYPYRLPPEEAVVKGPTIEDHVMIGGGSTLFPGITIGEGAFIGGGSVVNKDVPAWTMAYGNPARYYPLPERLSKGNHRAFTHPQTDLWGPRQDLTWMEELD